MNKPPFRRQLVFLKFSTLLIPHSSDQHLTFNDDKGDVEGKLHSH
jgi:hypothetical protein